MFVKNTAVNIGSFHIAPTQPIAVIVRKIKQTYLKREHFSSSIYHEPQAPARRPAAQNNSTPCHTGQDLAGLPRSVRLGSGDNKTRLHTSIRSQTTAVLRRGLHILRTKVMSLLAKGAVASLSPRRMVV